MRRGFILSGRSIALLALMIATLSGNAQNNAGHHWYFGTNGFGMRFNRIDNSVTLLSNGVALGQGGSGAASDAVTGSLLFYTDGVSVFDVTHNPMPNASLLAAPGPQGNQPIAITKVPGQKSQYYIFVNDADFMTPGTIRVQIVDMSQFGFATFPDPPQGDGTGGFTTVTGLTGRSEGMIVVPHFNGEDFWLITHILGTTNYTVTLIDAAGIGVSTPDVTYTGVGLIQVAANLTYHPGTGRIAVSPQEANRDVELFDFINTNGIINNPQRVLNTGVASTTNQTFYDTEFSTSGRYLYISRHGEPGITADLLQYDFLNPLTTIASVLPQPIDRSYGLKMAPDSAIYHIYQATPGGPFLLGAMRSADSVANDVDYNPLAFNSNPDINGRQFAATPPPDSIDLDVDFTSRGSCANSPVAFFPTVTPGADSLVWDFGDGNGTVNAWSPVYTYTAANTYTVQVTAYLNGDTAIVSHSVDITAFDLQLSLVQDTTACACEYKPPVGSSCNGGPFQVQVQAQGGGSPSYQWYGPPGAMVGQNSTTLIPDSAGYYYVVASITTAGVTCSAHAGVNIKTYDSLEQQANIWYFGQNAGIDFNGLPDDPPVAITGPLNTPEGTSVISDRNGQVIFSTDGLHIYDRDDVDITPAPNPPGLGGDSDATQSALIVPVPGDETLFYIFTTQPVHGTGTYELRYSLFDLKLNNGQGALAEYNQLLFSKSTERITSNGNWLIAHEFGNNSFRAYPISQQGIGTPVISAIGSDHLLSEEIQGRGYMEVGGGSLLAVALSTPGVSNVVEVFDFIDSTGMVTNFRTADLQSATGQVYGIEISPGGNKLYATLLDNNSQIVEFAFDSLGNVSFKNRVTQSGQQLGAMQIGPDGQIYVAIDGSINLGTFTANEDITQVTSLPIPLQPFALKTGTQSRLGLPNFVQTISNPPQSPGFTFSATCEHDTTQFSATGKDSNIDKFFWNFNDGSPTVADGGPQIAHKFPGPGTYDVSLIIYNKCEPLPAGIPGSPFTMKVRILPAPVDPSVSPLPPLCSIQSIDLDANPPDEKKMTYTWSTGDTTEVITINRQGTYTVTVTDSLGCSTDGSFAVNDGRPNVELGPDLTVCQNTPQGPLVAGNPAIASFVWQTNDVANGNTTERQTVSTATPGVFKYEVRVTNTTNAFGCFRNDSVTYTIKQSPVFTKSSTPPSACGVADGSITVAVTAPATSVFSYFISGPTAVPQQLDQTVASPPFSTGAILMAGTYGITVSDQISGCATINTETLNDATFTVTPTLNAICDPISLHVVLAPVQTTITYRVIDNATATAVETNSTGISGNPFFDTNAAGLPSNNRTYTVEVTSLGCIASSAPITINQAATVRTILSSNACVNPITVSATPTTAGAATYAWTGPNIQGSSAIQTILATPPQRLQVYNVTINQPGLCALDTTITVTVDNLVTADFNQSDPCADQATLTATPSGNYSYNWFRNGAGVIGGSTLAVTTADDDQLYRVDVVNSVTGCIFASPAKPVNVDGNLQITLTSTTPCEGSPFTLTATPNLTPVTYTWTRNSAPLAGQTASTLTETRDGLYVVSVSRGGCVRTLDADIVLAPVTPGLLTDTRIICAEAPDSDPQSQVVLDPGASFISYNWLFEGSPTGETTQTFTATEPGLYKVEMVNGFGCPSSDQTEVFDECDPRIVGPNAFRPSSSVSEGGEMVNQEFRLFTFFISDTDFHIFIFNRWGEMVYESGERDFRWNGGYNNNPGQLLPVGTYTYVVRYKSAYRPEEGIKEKRGGVVLMR